MGTSVAVVTGAGSGIGRALARQLDGEQYELVLCDVNAAGLAETQTFLKRAAKLVTLDVSKREDVEAMARDTLAQHGQVDLVINNAGVTVDATLAEVSYADFEWLFGINFWGVVYGTKAFLPSMLARKSGTIINISSIFGIIAHPGQGTYNAAKFAVRGFTEALWRELDGTGVHAVSVHPGGVKTNIARSARVPRADASMKDDFARRFEKLAATTPERAAEIILRGAYDKRKRVMVGMDAQLMQLVQRFFPEGYPDLFTAVEKRLKA